MGSGLDYPKIICLKVKLSVCITQPPPHRQKHMTHPLDGCQAKLERAQESIISLEAEIQKHLKDSPPPKVVGAFKPDGLIYEFTAYGRPIVPLRFQVITGEVIHHLRSCLDHLIYTLVTHNGKEPSRQNQFPIFSKESDFKSRSKSFLQGVPQGASEKITEMQPFNEQDPNDSILKIVSDLNNRDKHNLLIVVAAAAFLKRDIIIGTNIEIAQKLGREGKEVRIVNFISSDPMKKQLTEEGTVFFAIQLAEPAPEFIATADVSPFFALEKCGSLESPNLIKLLLHLHTGVKNTLNQFYSYF
jgi:hypothetical protein